MISGKSLSVERCTGRVGGCEDRGGVGDGCERYTSIPYFLLPLSKLYENKIVSVTLRHFFGIGSLFQAFR